MKKSIQQFLYNGSMRAVKKNFDARSLRLKCGLEEFLAVVGQNLLRKVPDNTIIRKLLKRFFPTTSNNNFSKFLLRMIRPVQRVPL